MRISTNLHVRGSWILVTRVGSRSACVVRRIRMRNSLECASPSWALLQFTNHAVYDGPKLGRTTSPGTSISPASQAFCKPPSGGLLLIYIAVPPDHPGRAHGHRLLRLDLGPRSPIFGQKCQHFCPTITSKRLDFWASDLRQALGMHLN